MMIININNQWSRICLALKTPHVVSVQSDSSVASLAAPLMFSRRWQQLSLWPYRAVHQDTPLNHFDLVILTHDLDLWVWPRYPSTWPAYQKSGPYVRLLHHESGNSLNRRTDVQTISKLLHPPLTLSGGCDAVWEKWCCLWDVMPSVRCDAVYEMWCCLWDVMPSVRCDAVYEMWCRLCLWDVMLSVRCDAVYGMWCRLWDVMPSVRCDAVYEMWCHLWDVMPSVRCDAICETWCWEMWCIQWLHFREMWCCDSYNKIIYSIIMMLSMMCGSRYLINKMTILNWL